MSEIDVGALLELAVSRNFRGGPARLSRRVERVVDDRPLATITTDGSLRGRWAGVAVVIRIGDSEDRFSWREDEHCSRSTRVELIGMVRGLQKLALPHRVVVRGDCLYLGSALRKARSGFGRSPDGDLLEELRGFLGVHHVEFRRVTAGTCPEMMWCDQNSKAEAWQ